MNQVFKDLLATRKMPTPSTIALEIMRLSTSENTSLNDIADIVEKDPALSGTLLKYANTVLFAATTPVASIRQAIVRLGTDVVMGLALGFSLLSKHREGRCEHFDYGGFWSGSLAMAMSALCLAENLGLAVIAEGVETVTELNFLLDNDCTTFQGYYFSRPLTPADFENRLKALLLAQKSPECLDTSPQELKL
jgi:HD-like signal output (HDOD) protein